MPRIKQKAAEYFGADLVKEIRKAGIDHGLKTITDISSRCGLSQKTMGDRFRNPASFKLGEIWVLASTLNLWKPIAELMLRNSRE